MKNDIKYFVGLSSSMIKKNMLVKDAFITDTGTYTDITAGTPCIIVQECTDTLSIHDSPQSVEDDEDSPEDDEDSPDVAGYDIADTYDQFPGDMEEEIVNNQLKDLSRSNYGEKNIMVILPFSMDGNHPNRRKISIDTSEQFPIRIKDAKKETSLLDRASLIDLMPIPKNQGNKNDFLSDKIINSFNIDKIISNNEFMTVTTVNIENSMVAIFRLVNSIIKIFPHVFTLFCKNKNSGVEKNYKNMGDLKLAISVSNVENHMPMLEKFSGIFLHLCVIRLEDSKKMGNLKTIFEVTMLFSDSKKAAFIDGDRILYNTDIKTMYNYISKNIRSLKLLGRNE